jgi:hypothetical protein
MMKNLYSAHLSNMTKHNSMQKFEFPNIQQMPSTRKK